MQELSATRTVTEAMTILKAMPLQAGELAPVHELGRAALKHVLEDCMRDKVRQYLEDLGRRGEADRRNGSFRRWLVTAMGALELCVPRTRSFSPVALVQAFARRERHVDRLILACFVLGLSTRKVGHALLTILGVRVSASTVSRVVDAARRGGGGVPPAPAGQPLPGAGGGRGGAGAAQRGRRRAAFIPWSFQPGNTELSQASEAAPALSLATAVDYLRVLALSRIYLDNIANVQASWVTQGLKVAQIALRFGANDFGSTMIEESVVRAAGVSYRVTKDDIIQAIRSAGFRPAQRDTYYRILRSF